MGSPDVNEILFSLTVATQRPARQESELSYGNKWVPAVVKLGVTSDFNEALKNSKRVLNHIKKSYDVMGYDLGLNFHLLPFNLWSLIWDISSRATTMGFSSIPGPETGFKFDGMKTQGMYAFYPPVGEQLNMMMVISMDGVLKINIGFDKAYVEKPELFAKLLKERMDAFIATEIVEKAKEKPSETKTQNDGQADSQEDG